MMDPSSITSFYCKDDGTIPNHPTLPVIIYSGVLRDRADKLESIFNENHWLNSWVNGVYGYHHFHSNTHEVLGMLQGSAALLIGGENGLILQLQAGDVLLLPAGTGHKRLEASPDFKAAGAYPGGMNYNLRTGKPSERTTVLEEIKQVPIPDYDPVFGAGGPLHEIWKDNADRL